MLGLEKIIAGAKLRGIAGPSVVEVVRVEWIGSDALNVVYRGSDGPAEVLLFREAEPRLEQVQASRAFSFDGVRLLPNQPDLCSSPRLQLDLYSLDK